MTMTFTFSKRFLNSRSFMIESCESVSELKTMFERVHSALNIVEPCSFPFLMPKESLPMCLAANLGRHFGRQAGSMGVKAKTQNFVSATALIIDIDDGLTIHAAEIKLHGLGLNYAIYTSASHLKPKMHAKTKLFIVSERFRIIIPLARPANAKEYALLLQKFVKMFYGDENASRICQRYYIPTPKAWWYVNDTGHDLDFKDAKVSYSSFNTKFYKIVSGGKIERCGYANIENDIAFERDISKYYATMPDIMMHSHQLSERHAEAYRLAPAGSKKDRYIKWLDRTGLLNSCSFSRKERRGYRIKAFTTSKDNAEMFLKHHKGIVAKLDDEQYLVIIKVLHKNVLMSLSDAGLRLTKSVPAEIYARIAHKLPKAPTFRDVKWLKKYCKRDSEAEVGENIDVDTSDEQLLPSAILRSSKNRNKKLQKLTRARIISHIIKLAHREDVGSYISTRKVARKFGVSSQTVAVIMEKLIGDKIFKISDAVWKKRCASYSVNPHAAAPSLSDVQVPSIIFAEGCFSNALMALERLNLSIEEWVTVEQNNSDFLGGKFDRLSKFYAARERCVTKVA